MVDKALFSSETGEWETPQEFYDNLNNIWKFNLDPCATDENAKCDYYFRKEDNGLKLDWDLPGCAKGRVFVNPPYGRGISEWVRKAVMEVARGNAVVVVMLLPARTDTKWWHDWIEPYATKVIFIRGRLKFKGASNPAPFPSVLAIFLQGDKYDTIYKD